jgi:hypothetical protein
VEGDETPKTQGIESSWKLDQNPMVLLGFRPKLFIYKMAGTQKAKGFRYWLKIKLGSTCYYSKVDLEYNKLFYKIMSKQWLFQHQING